MYRSVYGLFSGQKRLIREKWVHNAGWYNFFGRKIGQGDLAFRDLLNISIEIPGYRIFAVLPEKYLGGEGPSHVMEHFIYLVKRSVIYYANRNSFLSNARCEHQSLGFINKKFSGVSFRVIGPDQTDEVFTKTLIEIRAKTSNGLKN